MPPIRRFEELRVWQEGRQMHQRLAEACALPAMKQEFKLTGQLLSASRSITANIAEGFERYTPGEFTHFLYIAKGSAGEVRSLLYCAFDEKRLPEEIFKDIVARTESICRMLGALRAAIARRKKRS